MPTDPPAAPAAVSVGLSRGKALALAAAVFLGVVGFATGNFVYDVLVLGAIDAVIVLTWLLAGYGYGRVIFAAGGRTLADTPAGLAAVTRVALGLGAMSLLTLGLGLAGLLSNVTTWVEIAVGVTLLLPLPVPRGRVGEVGFSSSTDVGQTPSLTLPRNTGRGDKTRAWLAAKTHGANVAWLLAIPLAIAFIAASICPGFLWKPLDPHPYDVLSYHLQIPREWYDAGRILPLRHNSFSFFPMGLEMHFLSAMHLAGGAWRGMYVCQFMSLAHGALAVAGVIAVCRSMGVGPVLSRLAGLMTAAVPWVLMGASVCYVESGVMLYTLLAVAWAMRGMTENQAPDVTARAVDSSTPEKNPRLPPWRSILSRPLVAIALAGAFAGFACGMKYTAVAMTAVPLFVLWPILAWRSNGGAKTVLLPWAVGVLACGLVFSPWLVRNAVWSGNPVFPLAANVFGPGHFSADQVDRYQIAHAPPVAERTLAARTSAGFDRVVLDPQFGYLLVPLTILGGWACFRSPAVGLLGGMLVVMAAVWLLATHVMPRFLSPAVPMMAVLVAVGIGRLPGRPLAWLSGGAMAVQAVVGVVWTWNTLANTLPLARQGLFRLSDLTILETDDVKAARVSGDKIALIGDAQAFLYQLPSDRLLYRGVFDVTVPPGQSTADAWLGQSIDDLRRAGYWVVVNTAELDRLTKTYAHLPRPVPPWDEVRATPVVLPPMR